MQLEGKWFCIKEQKLLKVSSFPPALCHKELLGAEVAAELEEQQGQAEGQGHCSAPSQQVHENRSSAFTPASVIHLCKNMKANHCTRGVDAVEVLPAGGRGTAAFWNPLSLPCVFTGALLDKATLRCWGWLWLPFAGRAELGVTGLVTCKAQ